MVLKNVSRQELCSYLDQTICPPYGRVDLKNIFVKKMKGNDKDFLKALNLLSDLGKAFKNYLITTNYTYPSPRKFLGSKDVELVQNLRSAFANGREGARC